MRKIIASEFVSLNGVMEAPEQWHLPFVNSEFQAEINAGIHATDILVLGRNTYEIFAAAWSLRTQNEFGIADKLNTMRKFVISSSLERADWNNTKIINGNVTEEIAKLKQQPGGNIGITGSATLVQSLLQANLIDELRLWVHPIILGKGVHLFNNGLEGKVLKLVDSRMYSTGVLSLLYQATRDVA